MVDLAVEAERGRQVAAPYADHVGSRLQRRDLADARERLGSSSAHQSVTRSCWRFTCSGKSERREL